MPVAVVALSASDLMATTAPLNRNAPQVSSPSNHPCMVRVAGGLRSSRYRNDPYQCRVLPAIAQPPTAPAISLHTAKLPALPPAFQMASRTASRVKSEIARAATFTADEVDEASHETMLPAPQHQQQHQYRHVTPPPPSAPWCFVRLKHEVLLYNCPFQVEVGDYVVMEGDRGENIGSVTRLVAEHPRHPIQCSLVRFANDQDLANLEQQRNKEEAAKHFAQGVSDALGLNIKIVDTEFQSDGNKLTVYFASRRMIDFRKLQRQLFKQYRCRIWLVNWADVVKAQ